MTITADHETVTDLRSILLELARHQENLAADKLAATPYWANTPDCVVGHRTAAHALRAEADLLLVPGCGGA